MNVRRLGFSLFTLAMVAALTGLGLWQLQRRAEKLALIAALDQRLALAPVPLPLPGEWNIRIDVLISDYEIARLEGRIQIRP